MTDQEYGWFGGVEPRVEEVPDPAVGLVLALALLVLHHAALLVELGLVIAPSRWPMRSDSSQSTRSSALVGTFWK